MKSENASQTPAPAQSRVTLQIRGLGHVPAVKNSFYRIVDSETREWKRRCIESFISQLLSGTATTGSVTPMPLCPRSLIASLPHDDRWQICPSIRLESVKVAPGLEGAEIVIEPI